MCFPKIIVVHIVCRRNFQTASTKFYINVAVFNHWNHTIHKRHNHLVTTQPLIFRIFGVDTHSGVAHNCFRTSCGNHGIISFCILMQNLPFLIRRNYRIFGCIGNVVFQIIQFALFVTVDHLFGRKHRLGLGVPVDHTKTTVNQTFFVQVNEHFHHTFGARVVHCERRSVPIARRTEFTKLF